jgi:tetratricopeptide (TPR) repeat protein
MEDLSERLKRSMPAMIKRGNSIGDGLDSILQEAIDELRALVKEAPDHSEYQYRLAQTLRLAVVNAASAGLTDVARQDFLEGREVVNNLVSRFPDEPKYLFELANTLSQASRAESSDEAKDSLERAVKIAEHLFNRFPAVTEYQLLYGTALARLASNQAARGLQNDARHSLTTSVEILTPLAQQFPDQGTIQIPLAKNCQQLGELLCSMADGSPENAHYLERSRDELQTAIARFETYLAAPDERQKSGEKGMFNMETCCNLYKSLARTLSRLDLPEEAEQAQVRAARYSRPGPPPRTPPP